LVVRRRDEAKYRRIHLQSPRWASAMQAPAPELAPPPPACISTLMVRLCEDLLSRTRVKEPSCDGGKPARRTASANQRGILAAVCHEKRLPALLLLLLMLLLLLLLLLPVLLLLLLLLAPLLCVLLLLLLAPLQFGKKTRTRTGSVPRYGIRH
jgi:hypothetical protein